jgi:hypothetical protein
MARNLKPTRAQKVAQSKEQAPSNQNGEEKVVKQEQKPKGTKPDFTPREKVAELNRLREDLERLKAERTSGRLDDMVQGMLGTYFVGIHNDVTITKAFEFTVKVLENGRTVIEGPDGTYIYLEYIYEPTVTTQDKFQCYLAPGKIGEIQFQMTGFFQEALRPEIAIEKDVRRVRALNLREAKKVSQEVSVPTLTLATSDGVAVKKKQKPTCSLTDLVPGAIGRYNFADSSGNHCMVDYHSIRNDGKTVLEIHSMNPKHELAMAGIRVGLQLRGENLSEDRPIPDTALSRISQEHFDHLVIARKFFIERLTLAKTKNRQAA